MGTRNALVGLGSAYLELIGPDPDQEQPARPRPFGIDDLPEQSIRLVTFALSVDDLGSALAALAEHDVAFSAPAPMSRTKPDGSVLSWQLAFPDGFHGVMPFLIEWGSGVEHPAAGLPPGCTLDAINGRHPDGERLSSALEAVDAPYRVEVTNRPGLSAVVSTPQGTVEL